MTNETANEERRREWARRCVKAMIQRRGAAGMYVDLDVDTIAATLKELFADLERRTTISPKTMKAAKEVHDQFMLYCSESNIKATAQIIDTATNLTAKEYALGELVEACERFKEYVAVPFTPRWQSTKDALYAAARKAKAALEDK